MIMNSLCTFTRLCLPNFGRLGALGGHKGINTALSKRYLNFFFKYNITKGTKISKVKSITKYSGSIIGKIGADKPDQPKLGPPRNKGNEK